MRQNMYKFQQNIDKTFSLYQTYRPIIIKKN